MRWAWSLVPFMAVTVSAAVAGIRFSNADRAIIGTLARDPEVSARPRPPLPLREEAAVRLGRDLFFDPRVAGNNAWSCATCHQPARGWGDGEPTPSRFARVQRNTQALWDLARERLFFWDGREHDLGRQAFAPIESPDEMNSHRLKVALLILQDQHLLRKYLAAFSPPPDGLRHQIEASVRGRPARYDTWYEGYRALASQSRRAVDRMFANVGTALARFQRLLTSGISRFDRFADELNRRGRSAILSREEQRGLQLFIGRARCVSCHSGPTFSDGRLHHVDIWPRDHRPASTTTGTIAGRGREAPLPPGATRLLIRTARLRNVALTAPYLHDGRIASLEAFLDNSGTAGNDPHRLAGQLPDEDGRALLGFLLSLTDERFNRRDPGGLYAVEQAIGPSR